MSGVWTLGVWITDSISAAEFFVTVLSAAATLQLSSMTLPRKFEIRLQDKRNAF